jgi:hypothetical protein
MAVRVKTWVWVVVAIFVAGILLMIAMAGAGLYFFSQNIKATKVSEASAIKQFDDIRSQFTGQKALIELDDRGNFLRSNTDRPAPMNPKVPEKLYVMAFDPDDGSLVRVTIPFWLLRMKMKGTTIDFGGRNVELEDLKLTVEDLERFGPTLVLDQRNEGGDRVLVWSQ